VTGRGEPTIRKRASGSFARWQRSLSRFGTRARPVRQHPQVHPEAQLRSCAAAPPPTFVATARNRFAVRIPPWLGQRISLLQAARSREAARISRCDRLRAARRPLGWRRRPLRGAGDRAPQALWNRPEARCSIPAPNSVANDHLSSSQVPASPDPNALRTCRLELAPFQTRRLHTSATDRLDPSKCPDRWRSPDRIQP